MFILIFKESFTLIKILFAFYVLRFYYKYFTRPNPLPGPFPLPIVGSVLHVFYILFQNGIYQFDMGEYARIQAEKYGDISEIYMGNTRMFYLNRAEHLENVYSTSTNTKYFCRPAINGVLEVAGEYGLFFNNDFKNWKRIRKFVAQSLLSPKFLRGITGTVQNLFEEYEYKLKSQDEITFNLSEWIKCFTTDITISTSTGHKSYCLASMNLKDSEWNEEMKESRKILKAVELYFISLGFFSSIPKLVRLYVPGFTYYHNYYTDSITHFRENVLNKVIRRRKQLSQNEKVGSDLLDIILTNDDPKETEEPLSDIEIRDNILDLTVAGVDTSSNLFAVTFWYINTHPEVKARLLEEIKSTFGEDTTGCKITYDDLEKLKYLDATIKESFRKKPIIPVSAKVLSGSDSVAGYDWSSNTPFYLNNITIQNHKDYWKEPEKFNPDRFLNDDIVKNSFVPFGNGVRSCPGRYMAISVIKTLIILFFSRYNVELVDKVNPLQHKYAGVNMYLNLMVKLSPKKNIS